MTDKLAHKRSGCFLHEVLWAKARLSVLFRSVARTGVLWRLPSPLLPTVGKSNTKCKLDMTSSCVAVCWIFLFLTPTLLGGEKREVRERLYAFHPAEGERRTGLCLQSSHEKTSWGFSLQASSLGSWSGQFRHLRKAYRSERLLSSPPTTKV
ncbi:hypothetical protein DFP93_10947 [Aneurinibacillus soli]|uniref:Uncharacterized protein n=1 Tax=Aneurinibacillus soli TaxID=1500254 RepID=A0A0U5B3C4_9BACL|nr:hypothetical protein DFP93_10947 [Aneurinibacillus soli]BAU27823.1 hypothetical protein CB4_01997 [Aneurinibacillus soli]